MQKLLLSIILALFLALAMVGVKRVMTPPNTARPGSTMMASGGAPMPIPQ